MTNFVFTDNYHNNLKHVNSELQHPMRNVCTLKSGNETTDEFPKDSFSDYTLQLAYNQLLVLHITISDNIYIILQSLQAFITMVI